MILTVSFRRLGRFLGNDEGVALRVPLITPVQTERARQIKRTISIAARYTPWTSNCFPQAIVARVLLGLGGIPYSLFFGVARDPEEGLKAHAWVVSGRIHVSGGAGAGRFTAVRIYAWPALQNAGGASQ